MHAKGAFPTPSSDGGEQGDTGDTAQDLLEEVESMEEAFSQIHILTNLDSHN